MVSGIGTLLNKPIEKLAYTPVTCVSCHLDRETSLYICNLCKLSSLSMSPLE